MLNPRLQTFYEKIICEDFIVLYNFTNIARLPKIEQIILSSTSNSYGESKLSVLQSFCAWQMGASQKCITTRAHNSIALFHIRKGMLLGLKVTLRKKALFSFLEKARIFVLPKLFSNKNYSIQKDYLSLLKPINFSNKQNVLEPNKSNLLQFKSEAKPKLLFCCRSEAKEVQRSVPSNEKHTTLVLPHFLKSKHAFLQKLSKSLYLDFFSLPESFSQSLRFSFLNATKDTQWLQGNNNTNGMRGNSALSFPEIYALSSFFDSLSGFSLSFLCTKEKQLSIKRVNMSKTSRKIRENLVKRQLISALACPKLF